MNCSASATLWTRSALAMVVTRDSQSWEFRIARWKRDSTLAYGLPDTPRVWCLYWVTHLGGMHVQLRNHAAREAGVPASCGSGQAGQHPRHGGVPQDCGGS